MEKEFWFAGNPKYHVVPQEGVGSEAVDVPVGVAVLVGIKVTVTGMVAVELGVLVKVTGIVDVGVQVAVGVLVAAGRQLEIVKVTGVEY
jgi:hypothetical protein